MENELKRCPFCGGEALLQKQRVNGDDRFTYSWVLCIDCLGQTRRYLSAKSAIETWNRRWPDERRNH